MSRGQPLSDRRGLRDWLAEQPPGHVAWALAACAAVGAAVAGLVQDPGLAILILAAGALAAAITAFWVSLRALFGDRRMTAEEAYALAMPRAADEQKRAVLRALEDLEYERSAGKISEQDFVSLRRQYRTQARQLLTAEQQTSRSLHERVERLIAEQLAVSEQDEDDHEIDEPDEHAPDAPHELDDEPNVCPECETENDDDAAFCKRCGQALGPGSDPEP